MSSTSQQRAVWVMVPRHPTPEMWKAAKAVPDPVPPYPPHYALVWDAMLDAAPGAHPDDAAVDALAALMKTKLAKQRAKGYAGWDTPECTQEHLSNLLRSHVDKGDPVDIANFCAFLSARGEGIAPAAPSQDAEGAARLRVVIDLLRDTLYPLEVSAAVIESDDAEQMGGLIVRIRRVLDQYDAERVKQERQ